MQKITVQPKEYTCRYKSPIGGMILTSDGSNLTGLWFEHQKHSDECDSQALPEEMDLTIFRETRKWLDIYFTGKDPGFTPPLAINATPFRRRVCEIMLTIPYGQSMSYGDIARILEKERNAAVNNSLLKPVKRMSAQAVGGAVGHNPISLIIPCHRVIGSDGSLTGYGGGLDKKIALLNMESIQYKN